MNRLVVFICFMLVTSTVFCQRNKGIPIDKKKLEQYKARYESGERDIVFIKEYVDFLEGKGKVKVNSKLAFLIRGHRNPMTKKLVKDYVSKCPIRQLSEQAIWELAGDYLLDDVYSNAFEYVHSRLNKFKWGNVDSRYSIVSTLNRKIGSAVMEVAAPKKDKKGVYNMPGYDGEKVEWLKAMLNRNVINDAAKLKVVFKINDAYRDNAYSRMLDILKFGMELGMFDKDMNYISSIVGFLAYNSNDKNLLNNCLVMMNGFVERDAKSDGIGHNYYDVISKLYSKLGDKPKAVAAQKEYDAIEAKRMQRFGGFMNILNQKK